MPHVRANLSTIPCMAYYNNTIIFWWMHNGCMAINERNNSLVLPRLPWGGGRAITLTDDDIDRCTNHYYLCKGIED